MMKEKSSCPSCGHEIVTKTCDNCNSNTDKLFDVSDHPMIEEGSKLKEVCKECLEDINGELENSIEEYRELCKKSMKASLESYKKMVVGDGRLLREFTKNPPELY